MTSKFLQYSKKSGNDLSTPTENFPGLKPGDKWCICAPRYRYIIFLYFKFILFNTVLLEIII